MNGHPAPIHFREVTPISRGLRTARRIASLAGAGLAAILFLSSCATTQSSATKPVTPPDFTDYDVPLYQQVTKRIQTKILARLGEGPNTRDRYFMVPFAFENDGNDPEYSHSFITVIRVLADDKQPKLTPGILKRTYKDRNFEAFTISWLPNDFLTTHTICVFKGFGARLVPLMNKAPLSVGRAYNLPETVSMAVYAKNALCMWGPYEIAKGGFDLGVRRLRLLEGGTIKYRADDRGLRKEEKAINCFHAMAGLDVQYPDGGVLGTGFKTWGINGTARVLHEYTDREKYKQLLLEPVDEQNDRYGFVYAPTRFAQKIYNPFKVSSAYHK
jgi:hypothetical protein